MNRKSLVGLVLIAVLGGAGLVYFIMRAQTAAESKTEECIAGAGEICPSADFVQELKNLKKMAERQKLLAQDPKVKALVELMDTQRGMATRMQEEINQTLQANPGHQWDGKKEKFVPAPAPVVAPAPTPTK